MKIEQTFNITDFAELKGCSRQTVYSNIGKFDLDRKKRIIWNAKAKNWESDKKTIPVKFR